MSQAGKPMRPTAAERNEKVRQVLQAASRPLGSSEIAARIGENWCSWNGHGMGSAVLPALRAIGAKVDKGAWSLKAAPAAEPEPGCIGDMGMVPPGVMSHARWERLKAEMAVPQQ